MKSGHYIAIFVMVAVLVGAVIIFNARTIGDISKNVATEQTSIVPKENNSMTKEDNEIDVMNDADIESDMEDLVSDEDAELADVEDVMIEEEVIF